MIVYISGPIAGAADLTFEEKKDRFYRAATQFKSLGHEAVNPFEVSACSDMSCDPGQLADQPPGIHTWACYLRHDLIVMLEKCNAIALLPRYQESPGARLELLIAEKLGFKVFSVDEYGALAKEWR